MHDAVIIGAGAAGLAAAVEFARAGRSALLLEARNRVGGRAWTVNAPELPAPLELGAEFIHGRQPATFSLLAECGTAAVDRTGQGWYQERGRLRPVGDVFAEIRAAASTLRMPDPDISFEALLQRELSGLSARAKAFARRRVEGYDAAHAERISARAVLEEWGGEDEAVAPSHFRPSCGYGPLLERMAAGLAKSRVRLSLGAAVREVTWKRGGVEVEWLSAGKVRCSRARSAIVTVPLGVLQAPAGRRGAIRFVPALARKAQALGFLAASPVVKVVMRFRNAFWERIDGGRYAEAGFFRASGAAFPSYWTSLPVRVPLLVAWAGGPHADRMAALARDEIIDCALQGLESLFGRRAGVRRSFAAAWMHDWQSDPYARGAYSYVKVGGAGARRALARTLDDTLFFAGEATEATGEHGTVGGALQTGMRAAREALRGSA